MTLSATLKELAERATKARPADYGLLTNQETPPCQ